MRISSTSDFLHVAAMIEKVLQILFWSSTPVSRRVRVYLGSTLVAYKKIYTCLSWQKNNRSTRYIFDLSVFWGIFFYLDKGGI